MKKEQEVIIPEYKSMDSLLVMLNTPCQTKEQMKRMEIAVKETLKHTKKENEEFKKKIKEYIMHLYNLVFFLEKNIPEPPPPPSPFHFLENNNKEQEVEWDSFLDMSSSYFNNLPPPPPPPFPSAQDQDTEMLP